MLTGYAMTSVAVYRPVLAPLATNGHIMQVNRCFSDILLIIMPIKKPNNGASQPSSDLRQASLYAALLLGYTIHFIYCIWGNLSDREQSE